MSRLHFARRLTQVGFLALVVLLPVFDILRYDSATKELFLFGDVWTLGLGEGFYLDHSLHGSTHVAVRFFLKAILPWIAVLAVFPLLGTLFGRLFCGWLCPEGALFELADRLTLGILGRRSLFDDARHPQDAPGRRLLYAMAALALYVVMPPLLALAFSGFFVAPQTVWRQALTLDFSTGIRAAVIGSYVYMLLTFVLARHYFCQYVCAPGLMQMLFAWVSPRSLRIRFDRAEADRCTDCGQCEAVCFMGVKPRSGRRNINCVNCGECVTACRKELNGRGLFSFRFGPERPTRHPAQRGPHRALLPRRGAS